MWMKRSPWLQMRGMGAGAAATANWLTNAVVSHTFLPLIQVIGGSGAFWIYAVITACGTAWAYIQLPETKGGLREQTPRHALCKAYSLAHSRSGLHGLVISRDVTICVLFGRDMLRSLRPTLSTPCQQTCIEQDYYSHLTFAPLTATSKAILVSGRLGYGEIFELMADVISFTPAQD